MLLGDGRIGVLARLVYIFHESNNVSIMGFTALFGKLKQGVAHISTSVFTHMVATTLPHVSLHAYYVVLVANSVSNLAPLPIRLSLD